eukprot:11879440-Alexandrium_andersonii.AAC.1
MAVKREFQRNNRVDHSCIDPRLRPLVPREADPGGCATEFGLSVRLSGVCLRSPVARKERHQVGSMVAGLLDRS